MKRRIKNLGAIASFLALLLAAAVLAEPQQEPIGPDSINQLGSSRHTPAAIPSRPAYAGNVTELSVYTQTTTLGWQGYYGNVTGTIVLDDANNHTMYDWAIAHPEGEIYAVIQPVADWDQVSCATPAQISTIENNTYKFNTYPNGTLKPSLDADSITNTFAANFDGDFYVGSTRINATSGCKAAYLYVNDAPDPSKKFTETLLYDQVNANLIFTAILVENTATGFDGLPHDFQMIVAENGHNGDETTTTYYFYVELQ
ncbi:MAG: hypothetical protein QXW00_04140 [Candidatus Woesearchaeota archaeon]